MPPRGGKDIEGVVSGHGPDFSFMATRTKGRNLGRGQAWALTLAALLLSSQVQQAAAGALERAMLGKVAVVDLSHTIAGPSDPAGSEHHHLAGPPGAAERAAASLGTHLDAPSAFLKSKPTVAQIPLRDLLVQAVLIDATAKVARSPEFRLAVADLRAWERRNGRIPKQSLVLLYTGWARRWSDPTRYLNLDAQGVPRVPGFSAAALAFLALERDVWGVGLDAFTPETEGGEVGQVLLRAGKYRIENLTNLETLPAKGARLVIAPLPIEAASAPARVIAILP